MSRTDTAGEEVVGNPTVALGAWRNELWLICDPMSHTDHRRLKLSLLTVNEVLSSATEKKNMNENFH